MNTTPILDKPQRAEEATEQWIQARWPSLIHEHKRTQELVRKCAREMYETAIEDIREGVVVI